ncbi:precorrin-3B synthase [Streptomyces sp. AK02-01A]|uniref:precorrin-3B synthase n=1 Tax=Streptomyces sp. AK02-01A TaxID=3028648 RepID=UPI0029BB8810|nr:precorrin-3B synthase [Streptomyces sp. AK02-01A]MDX3851116.1 precorrin-3B synthase [Streptomyces sp. AK02-01A]
MLAAMPPTSPTPVNRDEAPVRERGDACPGALRLHTADDGRLARLRLPGGLLTRHQASVLASAAERLGDGRLDITSRGNVQLRGLGESCGAELAELLREAGLLPSERHERVRNIVASPLAGLDGLPGADVQLWTRELDTLLCASETATALSGRFLFALDDGRGDMAALGADVTLLARRDGTAALYTGTNRSAARDSGPHAPAALRVTAADASRAALLAAETFLTVAEASGSGAWRVRELPAGQGLDAAVAARLTGAGIAAEPLAAMPPPSAAAPPAGLVHSPDGTVAVSVYAPLGRLSVARWRTLTAGGDELRVTPWRGVIVPGLEPAAARGLLAGLRTAGLITDPDSSWYGVGACTGRPGCAKALSDVRTDAAGAMTAAPGGLPVYWSGCARRCGRPEGDRVDVVATGEGGYTISVVSVTGNLPAAPPPRTAATGPELAEAVATARTTPVTR